MTQTGCRVRVERDVMVSMCDGVLLATDIYYPVEEAALTSRYPVIMERTPYNKSGISRTENSLQNPQPQARSAVAESLVSHGYIVVMQDCRGRYRSEGMFTKYVNEAEDGYDTLLWLLQQSWCNGRIGTMGLSYGAHTQCALSCLNPPGLACMFMDSGGFSSAFHGGIRRGGAFELKQATWAYRHALLSPQAASNPTRLQALRDEDIERWFHNMPWRHGHSPLRHAPDYESYLFELWQHGQFNDYWKRPGLYAQGFYDQFPDVPISIIGSWYDPYVLTCLTNFTELARRKKSAMSLIMGPWTHGNRSCTWSGDVDFGVNATLDNNIAEDYASLRLAWFERWLKPDEVPGKTGERQVHYFQMGGGSGLRNVNGHLQHDGQWRRSDCWPPQQVSESRYYLHPQGALRTRAPQDDQAYLQYCFDPSDPVPTVGGALTSGEPVMRGGAFDQRSLPGKFGFDASAGSQPLSDRADVLVFQTKPLTSDTIITGAVEAHLWVSSDRPDTDFTVKLIDLYPPSADYPHGFAMNITDGVFRVRYREGWDKEVMLTPGEIVKIIIEPFASSNLFRKGHQLRIDISSSNFPHFDVNPNTGAAEGVYGEFAKASNRVYCDREHPSYIKLFVEPQADRPGDDA